jgi:hypothetical protein
MSRALDHGGMSLRRASAVLFLALAACSRQPTPVADPTKDPTHPCMWFTADELGKRVGARLGAGKSAGPLGLAGHWLGEGDPKVYVQIVVTRDASFWKVPTTPDVKVLSGIGKGAYVQPTADGWSAAGCLDRMFVTVFVGGPVATAAVAERLVVDTLSRAR